MSFFRTYIDSSIQKELFNREDSINFRKNAEGILEPVESNIEHQFIKSCWARASVVLGNGEVFSLNSNLYDLIDKDPIREPLNINKNKNPYRGRPGITSISTSFKEFFLKQATINFFVPNAMVDKEQEFDVFKDRFLKFGRYILIEFGWTQPKNLTLPEISADNIIDFSKGLDNRIKKSEGNYNALVGVVTNYNFSQTKEGAYEGTIEVSSMGRNVIGQQTPIASSQDKNIENVVGYVNEVLSNLQSGDSLGDKQKKVFGKLRDTYVNFQSVINKLGDVVESYVKGDKEKADDFISETEVTTAGLAGGVAFEGRRNIFKENGVFMYQPNSDDVDEYTNLYNESKVILISWGWFEDFILNSYFSFVSKNEKVLFKTEFFSADTLSNLTTLNEGTNGDPEVVAVKGALGEENTEAEFIHFNNRCKSHPELFSLGLDSIILPGKTKEFTLKDGDDKSTRLLKNLIDKINDPENLFQFEDKDKNGIIRNMYFNVEYIKESFEGTSNIEDAIQNFWRKVSNDYGYFWNFSLIENEKIDGRMMITDMNVGKEKGSTEDSISTPLDPDKIFKFKVYSQDSIVSNLDLQTANSSEMATLAVYGANANLEKTSADTGQGYSELAMRALSIIDNTGVTANTNNKTKRSQYFDNILNNISNPVFGNFADSQGARFEGASAIYNKDGSVDIQNRKRSDGILFSDVPEVTQTNKEITRQLTDITYSRGFSSAEEEITNSLFWFTDEDKSIQIYGESSLQIIPEFKRTMLFRINKAPGTDSNYSVVLPVIPIQLSLTLQGIGGIKVGDLFTVDYLPKIYRDYCSFMVVNVEHEISTTGWTSKLDSRMIVNIPKFLKDNDASQLNPIDYIFVEKSIEDTKEQITKIYNKETAVAENRFKGEQIIGRRADEEKLKDLQEGRGLYYGYEQRLENFAKKLVSPATPGINERTGLPE